MPPQAGLFLVVLLVGALATARAPEFLTQSNLVALFRDTSTYFIVACPLALLIIAGGLDFSVGATFSVGAVIAATLMTHGIAWPLAVLAGLLAGAGTGLFGGLLVVYLQVPPFIATLAVFFVASGLINSLVKGLITPLPDGFQQVGQDTLLGIPLLVWYAVAVGLVSRIVLEKTRFGYHLRAVGGNRPAAHASGIRVRRIDLGVYALSGGVAALAGILYASRTAAGQPDAGGYLLTLEVLTMVLVGGVSLSGGVGSIGSVALGAVLLGELQNALGVTQLDPALSSVFIGVILALAVAVDGLRRSRRFVSREVTRGSSGSVSRLELERLVRSHGEVQAARIVAAVDSERQRIERDLHDGTQQELISAVMILQEAREKLSRPDDEAVTELLSVGVARLQAASQELRDLSRGVYPNSLSELGLMVAVEGLVQRSTLRITLQADDVPRLGERTEMAAYFVIAEALTNVLKHAHAESVEVSIAYDEQERLRATVADDGTGTVDETRGTGLRGLRERVRAAGGQLTLTSAPGSGTALAANFPADRRVDAS